MPNPLFFYRRKLPHHQRNDSLSEVHKGIFEISFKLICTFLLKGLLT